jgi:hypothetical protein
MIFWQALKKNEKSFIKTPMGKKPLRVFLDSNIILSPHTSVLICCLKADLANEALAQ